MIVEGWYYLHTNGSLVYKPALDPKVESDIVNSDFALAMWRLDSRDRRNAWRILIEAAALGLAADRLEAMSELWNCSDNDATTYAYHIGLNLQYSPSRGWMTGTHNCKYGASAATALGALKLLCQTMGYVGGKPAPKSFEDLLKENM